MLTNLIESRGKEFSNLLKLSDYLARSLRENVELFYVENGKATFITESGGVITGNYQIKPSLKLSNIQVDNSDVLKDQKAFESVTSQKVSCLLSNLLESDYGGAENSFDEILSLFETKLSFDRINERLVDKSERFGEQNRIVSSPEFQKVSELKDSIVEFIKANKSIVKIPEIKNGMKLASVVSKAFNIPKITLEQLAQAKSFQVKIPTQNSIYEHLCRQELVAKELLEAKQNFDTTWANNELLAELASMVYGNKRSKLEEKVAEVVSQIPYFALATKKQITSIFENALALNDVKVSTKDLTTFVSHIFEMRKPVKNYIIKLLNEKYGINISNLTDVPTFSNLLKTEMVVLASIAKLAPKNSLIKETLFNLAESLKLKNGSESIDLVDFLNEVFTLAGLKESINETSLLQYLDFAQVADDLGKIGSILKLLRPILGGAAGGGAGGAGGGMPSMGGGGLPSMDGGTGSAPTPGAIPGQEEEGEAPPSIEGVEGDTLSGPLGDAEGAASDVLNGEQGEEGMEGIPGQEEGIPGQEEMPPEEGGMPPAQGGEDELGQDPLDAALGGMGGEDQEEPVDNVNSDDITNIVASIEDLLSSIKSEIGGGDEGGFPEEGMEGEGDLEGIPGQEGDLPPEEGGEEGGIPDIDTGEGDDEVNLDLDSDDGEEDEEEKAPPAKKGKGFPPKK